MAAYGSESGRSSNAAQNRRFQGGHPKELPGRVLALVRHFPAGQPMPKDLKQLCAAALHYWSVFDRLPEGEREPDPLDLEMVCDEFIDALYDYYEVR